MELNVNAKSFIQIVKSSRKEQVANFGTWFPASADGATLKVAIDNKVMMLESQLDNLKKFKDVTSEELDKVINHEKAASLLYSLSKDELKDFLDKMN